MQKSSFLIRLIATNRLLSEQREPNILRVFLFQRDNNLIVFHNISATLRKSSVLQSWNRKLVVFAIETSNFEFKALFKESSLNLVLWNRMHISTVQEYPIFSVIQSSIDF